MTLRYLHTAADRASDQRRLSLDHLSPALANHDIQGVYRS
jgi:hypothetical protein